MSRSVYHSVLLLSCLFFLASCADLEVKNLSHSPQNPTTADMITFTAVVENAGKKPSEPSELSFKVGGESNPPVYPVPALAVGATHTVQRQLQLNVAQNYRNTVTVDINNAVKESNEHNNIMTEDYTVTAATLESWLASHPAVASAIQWERPSSSPGDMVAYSDWTPEMKNDLSNAWSTATHGQSAGLPAIPDTELTLNNAGTVFAVQVQEDLAWEYYITYVAQSLKAETEGWFPWSLTSYDSASLNALFDSRSLFDWGTGPQRYMILKMHNILPSHGMATPSDPGTTLKMLEDLGLVGATPAETLNNIFAWDRDNLMHFYGAETPDNNMAHWGFRGYPPVQKILEGTDRQTGSSGTEFGHWTAGCWGTTAFMRLVSKVLNIPVELVNLNGATGTHAAPHFVAEGTYWSHGDDPYNWVSREFIPVTPPAPPGEYFFDEAQYQTWFGPGAFGHNIGRRVAEVGVEYLTDYLLQKHCADMSSGSTHAASQVYSTLSTFYTVAELESQNLWSRLDQKITDIGGCTIIP